MDYGQAWQQEAVITNIIDKSKGCPIKYQKSGILFGMDKKCVSRRKADFYILFFFVASLIGWLWEVAIYLVLTGDFINRGAFYGPYLPIYGVGSLLLWFALQRFHQRKWITFVLATVICSALEYATGAYLEWKWGMQWWDYSGLWLNIDGHICLLSVVFFGLGGMFLNCYVMPYYMRLYHRVSAGRRRILCVVLITVFAVDLIWCLMRPHTGEYITVMTFLNIL